MKIYNAFLPFVLPAHSGKHEGSGHIYVLTEWTIEELGIWTRIT